MSVRLQSRVLGVSLAVLGILHSATAVAENPQPAASPEPRIEEFHPKALPADDSPPAPIARAGGPTLDPSRNSVGAGGLGGLRALTLADGEARVSFEGTERTIRVGDALGTDVVRRIEEGRIVLLRPADSKAGEATVVVSFDATGRARVRVYSTLDPTRTVPREVK
jgi:hypothetical protein